MTAEMARCRPGHSHYNNRPIAPSMVPSAPLLLLLLVPLVQACNPLTYNYKTQFKYNPKDNRNYTLYDVDAGCMPDWATAKQVCERHGQELAPVDEEASMDALRNLCAKNRFTCWMDGKATPGFCHCMSQEGFTLEQGCGQTARFVCRTKGDNVLTLYHKGYDYRMYTVDAKQRMPYTKAEKFCRDLGTGWDLVPYSDKSGYNAVRELCTKNRYPCWFKKVGKDEHCPHINIEGLLRKEGCAQDMRFACRKKRVAQ